MTKADLANAHLDSPDEMDMPDEWSAPSAPEPVSTDPGQIEIVDVWSRTSPKYRRRSIIFLLCSALLFCGLGCFTFWIRTGHFFAPAMENYPGLLWDSFNWRGETQITLTDMLFDPIDSRRVPKMLVIVGLTIGSLFAIPILVAILYRRPAALVFVAIIGFLAVMPWLAVMVLLSCWISGNRRIRLRYVSAMLGLVPMVVYFIGATASSTSFATQLAPAEQIKLYLPWIFALLSAAALMALVLGFARIVNYRPGVIAPLLAVSFAIPVVLFETQVGRDELHYRVLEREFGRLSVRHFVNQDRATVIDRLAREQFRTQAGTRRSLERIRDDIGWWWGPAFDAAVQDLAAHEIDVARSQYEVVQACDRFRTDYSKSKYVPNVLYLQARALDMRVDRERFMQEAVLEHYTDFPSPASRSVWVTLLTRYPRSPLSGVARLRLAHFQVREGRVGQAIELLQELEESSADYANDEAATISMFESERPEASLIIALPRVVQDGRKLIDLLTRNRGGTHGDSPLIAFMRVDKRHPQSSHNYGLLRVRFADSPLADNLELCSVLRIASRTLREDALANFLERHAGGDAAERALFELGVLYEADVQREQALKTLRSLVSSYPSSPWAFEASRRMEVIERRLQSRS